MKELADKVKTKIVIMKDDNSGVAAIEIILILVVLIALVIIFKTQAVSLVNSIWESIKEGASSVTGS